VKALIIFGSIMALLLVVAGVGAYVAYQKFGQIQVIGEDVNTAPAPAATDPVNVLLLGSDTRTGKGNNEYGKDAGRGGARSDTTILLHIAADRSRALAVSIPRDLWVKQPDCANPDKLENYEFKFNNAFDEGGASCTTELVQQLTAVPVHHVAVVDFTGFKNVVDALGGVEVCLTKAVDDPHSKLKLPAGTSLVAGEQALAFVRARYNLGDGSDTDRIKRQQAFLSSAIRKVTDTQLLLNPARMYSVLDTATRALTVDRSLDSIGEMRQLVDGLRNVRPANITFVTLPSQDRGDGANVEVIPDQAATIYKAIVDDATWPPAISVGSDGQKLTVQPTDISVSIVDGSRGATSIRKVSEELVEAGFNVTETSTAPQKQDATRVRYNASEAEEARTLGFATKSLMVEDSGAASLTLEVGEDWKGVQSGIIVKKAKVEVDASGATPADKVVCAN